MKSIREVELQLVLDSSVPGTLGGIQTFKGAQGVVREWQKMTGSEARFTAKAQIRDGKLPLRGDAIQKDSKGRFLYLVWRDGTGVVHRRAKIYIETISEDMLDSAKALRILLPGKAKDGLPCCATVKPLQDWRVSEPESEAPEL